MKAHEATSKDIVGNLEVLAVRRVPKLLGSAWELQVKAYVWYLEIGMILFISLVCLRLAVVLGRKMSASPLQMNYR